MTPTVDPRVKAIYESLAVRWSILPGGSAPFIASRSEYLTAEVVARPPADWDNAIVELHLDALDGAAPVSAAAVFDPPAADRSLDPRQPDSRQAVARASSEDEAEQLGVFWGSVLANAGACGALLYGWSSIPEERHRSLIRSMRHAAPDKILLVTADDSSLTLRAEADGVVISLEGIKTPGDAVLAQMHGLKTHPKIIAQVGDDRLALELAAACALPTIGSASDPTIFPVTSPETTPPVSEVAHILSAPGDPVFISLRSPGDPRFAPRAALHLVNLKALSVSVDPASFLPAMRGLFGSFTVGDRTLVPGEPVELGPHKALVFEARRLADRQNAPVAAASGRHAAQMPRVAIEAISPIVDGGAFAVKRIAGDCVRVEADLICDGHDKLSAAIQWRGPVLGIEAPVWIEVAMRPLGNDRWSAAFPTVTLGLYEFRVLAWHDTYETFRDEVAKKHHAGVPIALELREGTALLDAALTRSDEMALNDRLVSLRGRLEGADEDAYRELLLSDEASAVMRQVDARIGVSESAIYRVDAERTGAGFASWYEVFPRSLSDDPARHGTFADVERHLSRIAKMGFDVLYFPPIHPIGNANRKGRNNTLTPGDTDPGSPYAIGTEAGGHDALHPELGTLADFLHLREAAAAHGLELALDFAIQCSPDHPWLREHRDWFAWRPDGSIRYAENPPKKYQDIVNVDFYAPGAIPHLWVALCNVVLFWAENGVRLFRVDNPHTKPFPFWQWLIAEVRSRFPDAVFLAEAFTRPKVMNRLAKIGFSQSYTYFTWRNTRAELEEYLTQLTTGPEQEFFRPHFFVNTPDINPTFLQNSGRAGHLVRAALAATLSGLWGVYNGFELCEATPLAPGKEEYLDSEKFELKAWDWTRAGNIVPEITRLNHVRLANSALQRTAGLSFLSSSDPAVIAYEKATDSRGNVICCFVSLDPGNVHDTHIGLPLWKAGLQDDAHIEVEDLMSGTRFGLNGAWHDVRLTPDMPFILWRLVL